MTSFSNVAAISVLGGAIILGITGAQGAPLFAVDVLSDDLVRIESSTGAVTVVGALGVNALDIDLARTADGRLWGLNSNFQNRVDLLEINTATGAQISSVQVTISGGTVISAEGLGHAGNQLNLGYSTAGDFDSDGFADLATSGAITNTVIPGIDMDGLVAGAGTVPFYAVDRVPVEDRTFVYEIDPTVPGNTLIATFSATTVLANDLVRIGSEIFMIGPTVLYSFDLAAPTVLTTINLDRDGKYVGLAVADPVGVPEPATLAIFGLGLAGLGLMRRRRKIN